MNNESLDIGETVINVTVCSNGRPKLKLIATQRDVTDAIDNFNQQYHDDYQIVREASTRYLQETHPTPETTLHLSRFLFCALRSWGSGKRAAPPVRGVSDLARELLDTQLHGQLRKLDGVSLSHLRMSGQRPIVNAPPDSPNASALANIQVSLLHTLSDKLFDNNKNVTYPMKALLLITGFSPAFDSQVRGGLSAAGFKGMTTRFSMPIERDKANDKKIRMLPFYLGQCWAQYEEVLASGIRKSKHKNLVDEPGRVFDVLLFMQGSDGRKLFEFTFSSAWYEIPHAGSRHDNKDGVMKNGAEMSNIAKRIEELEPEVYHAIYPFCWGTVLDEVREKFPVLNDEDQRYEAAVKYLRILKMAKGEKDRDSSLWRKMERWD